MRKSSGTQRLAITVATACLMFSSAIASAHAPARSATWWQFQSVDTMKYSRDISREFLSKKTELAAIADQQVHAISETGTTHVAIATPYDAEFLPILEIWVTAARNHNLKVWYRGNWSGWEGWFGYDKISRQEHHNLTEAFILAHPELFEDGDAFTACPECENGGTGDPRMTGDTIGYRKFLIDEHNMMEAAFDSIGKNVTFNFNSMNGDVARLIMDAPTTAALGGIVTIDHYVATSEKLVTDIKALAKQSGGSIVLGEFGAPIPDIHGKHTDSQQATWIADALAAIAPLPEVVGVSYWTNQGGSTALWTDSGEPKLGVSALAKAFTPSALHGTIQTASGKKLAGATVRSHHRTVVSDENGEFVLPIIDHTGELQVSKDLYLSTVMPLSELQNGAVLTLAEPQRTTSERFSLLLQQVREYVQRFFAK